MNTSNDNTQKGDSTVDVYTKKDIENPLSKARKQSKRSIVFSRLKRRILKHVWLVRISIILVVVAVGYLAVVIAGLVVRGRLDGSYVGLAYDFLTTPEEKIEAIGGKTNILLLGKGGGGHDAPDLTDTIIFLSLDHDNSSINMISLPRDIWIPEIRAKLNSTYYWGNQKEEGGGFKLAKSTVESIVGQPVQYGVVVDFDGFIKIIDVMGGVEVDVENEFTDERYPIPGREDDECEGDPEFLCRYETLRFAQGKQLMDGDTALKFVRSRNAEGDEGTDIARARRQQKIITAIKEKVMSTDVIFSPSKLFEIQDVLIESTETDIDPSAAAILARLTLNARDNIKSHVISEELLFNPDKLPRYDFLYVFIPKAIDPDTERPSWTEVHKWVECVLENEGCD